NILTGCVTSKSLYLADDINTPVVAATPSPFTTCISPDGSVTASITSDGTAPGRYSYVWYYGEDAVASEVMSGETGASITNQVPGKYTVVVTNIFTGCVAEPVTAEILDNSIKLVI